MKTPTRSSKKSDHQSSQIAPHNGTVAFIIEGKPFTSERAGISNKSRYFEQLISQFAPDQEIRIIMPKWVTKTSFLLLLKYVKGEPIFDVEVSTAQRLLWLSDFLKIESLEELCIKSLILPKLTKDNVLVFLEDSYAKISASASMDEGEINDSWNLLLAECLELAAKNIHYLARISKTALLKLEPIMIEELVDRAFKLFMTNLGTDNGSIIDLLMRVKDVNDPFDLLENERLKVWEKEKTYYASGDATPNLTWNLSKLSGNFYRESEPFYVLGCYWVLSIWSYKQAGAVYIAIKQSKTPKEVEEQLNSTCKEMVSPPKKKSASEIAEQGKVPNHCILTAATFVSIRELDEAGEGTFQVASLISASKAPTVIRVMKIEELEEIGGQMSIDIFLKLEYTHSGILTYISKNFGWLYNNVKVGRMTRNQFLTLLKHKYLNVKREEEALFALCIWMRENKGLCENIKELLENINWGYVSIHSLVDITSNFPLLRENALFKGIFSEEMNRRFENKDPQEPARYSYRYQKNEENRVPFLNTLSNAFLEQRCEITKMLSNIEEPA